MVPPLHSYLEYEKAKELHAKLVKRLENIGMPVDQQKEIHELSLRVFLYERDNNITAAP